MKMIHIFFRAGVFSFFLIAGFSIGTQRSEFQNFFDLLQARYHQGEMIPSLNNGQRSLLIISTPDITVENPELESIWLLTYIPGNSPITFLPIYPSPVRTNTPKDDCLTNAFKVRKLGAKYLLDPEFINLLKERKIWWSGYILLDHNTTRQIIDILSEIVENEISSSEFQISEYFPPIKQQPYQLLAYQTEIMQDVCWYISKMSLTDHSIIFDAMKGHLFSNLNDIAIENEWYTYQQNSTLMGCDFPFLNLQTTAAHETNFNISDYIQR
jgi:hypothetical protein